MPLHIESQFQTRRVADRRSGVDLRSPELRLAEGERRHGERRRAKAGLGSQPLRLALIAAAVFCAYDLRYLNGQHTQVPLFEAAEAANALASHWVGSPFSR